MKQLLICLLLGSMISCNSHDRYHQDILDDLSGTYRIDSVVYITATGQDSVLANAGMFTFNACDVDDNFSSKICSGSYEDSFGQNAVFKYQLVNDENITITPKEDPIIFNLRNGTISFYLKNSKLYLEFYSRENYVTAAEYKWPQLLVLSQ